MEREEDEGGLAGETFTDYVLSPAVLCLLNSWILKDLD